MILKLISLIKKIDRYFTQFMYLEYRKKYSIDKKFRFNGKGIIFGGPGKIIAGANSYIGRYSSIQAAEGFKVIIGKNVSISHFVKIYTQNSNPDQDFKNKGLNGFEYIKGDVIIGDYAWIGASVFIKEGVTIGENSVIGANSVVISDIPSFSIAAGTPAKVIRMKKQNTSISWSRLEKIS